MGSKNVWTPVWRVLLGLPNGGGYGGHTGHQKWTSGHEISLGGHQGVHIDISQALVSGLFEDRWATIFTEIQERAVDILVLALLPKLIVQLT